MEVKIINNEKKALEFEVSDCDQSIFNYLVEKLNKKSDVEFAAYKLDHPTIGSPRMVIRTKKEDALDLVLDELENLKKELTLFRKEFKNAVK